MGIFFIKLCSADDNIIPVKSTISKESFKRVIGFHGTRRYDKDREDDMRRENKNVWSP